MFVGHFGVGLAAKRVAPRVSLGTFFLAVQWADLLWPMLLLAGVEHVRIAPGLMKLCALDFYDYPWSHSLAALVLWGTLFGAVYWMVRRDARAALIVGLCVVSHWVLDVVMHRPDVPMLPRGPYLGLGLWNSVPGALIVEGLVFGAGIAVYVGTTRPKDRVGMWALWLLLGLLTALWMGALFGPPPPSPRVLAVSGLFGWIILPWAYWIDRHRTVRAPSVNRNSRSTLLSVSG
jgi:hypothetical protein